MCGCERSANAPLIGRHPRIVTVVPGKPVGRQQAGFARTSRTSVLRGRVRMIATLPVADYWINVSSHRR